MPTKTIFISHIHEEKDLAMLIQGELINEFSGFVTVFVSSDGISIPSGANFLNRIEAALSECSAAIYLISERSVKRNWINFELGAVWIRSCIQKNSGGIEIPAIPFCHSGVSPSSLPQPLGNLNAIKANDSIHLEKSFRSLQAAMGGSGNLKTNFVDLAENVRKLELKYTIGSSLKHLLSPLKDNIPEIISTCEKMPPGATLTLKLNFRDQNIISMMKGYESEQLKGDIQVNLEKHGMQTGPNGTVTGAEVTVLLKSDLIKSFKEIISN